MWVVAFIEDPYVVKKILQHLDLWDFKKPAAADPSRHARIGPNKDFRPRISD